MISSALRNLLRSSSVSLRISRRTYLHMSGMPVIAPTMYSPDASVAVSESTYCDAAFLNWITNSGVVPLANATPFSPCVARVWPRMLPQPASHRLSTFHS